MKITKFSILLKFDFDEMNRFEMALLNINDFFNCRRFFRKAEVYLK